MLHIISSWFFALHQDNFNNHKKAVECVINELRVIAIHVVAQPVTSFM